MYLRKRFQSVTATAFNALQFMQCCINIGTLLLQNTATFPNAVEKRRQLPRLPLIRVVQFNDVSNFAQRQAQTFAA